MTEQTSSKPLCYRIGRFIGLVIGAFLRVFD